jgi:hypothetical protein
MKVGLCDFYAVCVSVNRLINFWVPEQTFMELGICILTNESIWEPYYKNPTSLCLCLFLLSLLGDRLCCLVVRVLGYRFGGPGSIPGTTRFSEKKNGKQVVGLERDPLSLVSTTEELLDKKVAAPV